jgi:hypothetical protein
MTATPIYLEVGKKKVFACALGWPGWSRAGKTEEDAIETLATYADRYADVVHEAGLVWPKRVADDFEIVERVPGNATTDFGAPGEIADFDRQPVAAAERRRQAKLIEATWAVFDRIVAVTPDELRKGPRGGGRNRDKMVDHVLGAETSYVRKIGVKHPVPARDDAAAITALRADVVAAVVAGPTDDKWPVRYLARRLAWHVLDHAWEMQDKSDPS